MLCLRVSVAELEAFRQAAARSGHASLAAWAMERLQAGDGPDPRTRREICGWLGQLGAFLTRIAAQMRPSAARTVLEDLARDVVGKQRMIMGEAGDAGEGDPAHDRDPRR